MRNDRTNGETLGEALVASMQAVEDAEAKFRAMLREASNRGASTREIATLLSMSHSTLWRWMEGGGRRRKTNVLGKSRERLG